MKRVLSLVLALVLVLGMIPTFAAGETGAELLKQYEFISGDQNGDLMVDSMLTRSQLAALIAELNGVKEEAAAFTQPADFSDIATAQDWAKPFIAYAQVNEWMNGYPDGTFGPKGEVPSQQLAAVLMNALGYEVVWNTVIADAAELGIELPATGNLTRGEAFEAMWVAVSEVPMNTEEGLTIGQATGRLETVGELEIVSAAAAGIKKVEVKFNQAVDTTKAVLKIKKGAAIYAGTVTWNEDKDTATIATLIALPAADYTVEVSGLDEVLTASFTVAAEAAKTIEVTTATLDDNATAAKVEFAVKNQYGEAMNIYSNTTGVVISGYNVTQNAVVATTTGAFKYFTVNTAATADAFKTGDVVRFIVSYAGLTGQANLTVQQPAKLSTLQLGQVVLATDDTRLNVADATVELSYVGLDQYGNAAKLTANKADAAAIATADGVQFISSNAAVISGFKTDANNKLILTIAGSGTATVTAVVNASGSVSTTQVVVNANGTATTASIASPTTIVAAGDDAFDLAVSIIDQYGDAVKTNAGLTVTLKDANAEIAALKLTLSAKADKLSVDPSALIATATRTATIEIKNGTTVVGTVAFAIEPNAVASQLYSVVAPTTYENEATYSFSTDDVVVYDQYGREFTPGSVTITEKADGDVNNVVVLAGNDATIHATNVGSATLTATVGSVTKDFTITAVASTAVKSFTLTYAKPVFVSTNTAYHVTPVLAGALEDGTEVVLKDGKVTLWTSSNPAVATIAAGKVQGIAAGTVDVSAWNGATKLATVTLTVSTATPVPTTMSLTAATVASGTDLTTKLAIKDQYGVVITSDLLGTWVKSAGDAAVAADGTITGTTGQTATVSFITSNGIICTAVFTIQ